MSRSIVAVSATTEVIRGMLRVRLNAAYVDALEGAGLIPLITGPLHDPARADETIARVDGLVLTGGEDVDPRHYSATPHPAAEPPNPSRDRWELALVAAARARRIPVLAICRGQQLVNVALGGTLIQDLSSERGTGAAHTRSDRRAERVHAIDIVDGSRLARAAGDRSITVNSSHHQAIDRIAPGLHATAHAPDGTIEGVETPDDDWWVVGVQWHPEELTGTSEAWDRRLFDSFATRVAARTSAAGTPDDLEANNRRITRNAPSASGAQS